MIPKCFLLVLLTSSVLGLGYQRYTCPNIDTIHWNLRDIYCDQPIFVNIMPKNSNSMLYDNICLTFFPMPDDPSTFNDVASIVYCDGSHEILTSITTDVSQGVHKVAHPFVTFTSSVFGYAGCDTYLSYVCALFAPSNIRHVIGLSSSCAPLGLSCLRKVEEIINDHRLPDQDFYVLPMKLPSRCVTQRQCTIKENNPFYKNLGISGPFITSSYV